jgi:cyclopropane fatty-acyl-phospholipid synthase-like methyltransferase
MEKKLKEELHSFENMWKGGYYEGNPLDPMGESGYGILGYMSVLHVIYLACIKPYVNENSFVLEIGPGRGAWTKTFIHQKAKEIWCLDVLSAEHNRFWEYIGHENKDKTKYIQVADFTCNDLPDQKFNYLFSFGALCHISFAGITEYMKNLYSKLVDGGQCFIMVADYEKYNNAIRNINRLSVFRIIDSVKSRKYYKKYIYNFIKLFLEQLIIKTKCDLKPLKMPEDDVARSGRWYNAGIEKTCDMLEKLGYKVIAPDMGVSNRDPIIHFCKPKL